MALAGLLQRRQFAGRGAYGLLNLNLGVALASGWDVQLYAQNLDDEEYLIDAGNTGALFGIPTYVPGSPRLYGMRVSARL